MATGDLLCPECWQTALWYLRCVFVERRPAVAQADAVEQFAVQPALSGWSCGLYINHYQEVLFMPEPVQISPGKRLLY